MFISTSVKSHVMLIIHVRVETWCGAGDAKIADIHKLKSLRKYTEISSLYLRMSLPVLVQIWFVFPAIVVSSLIFCSCTAQWYLETYLKGQFYVRTSPTCGYSKHEAVSITSKLNYVQNTTSLFMWPTTLVLNCSHHYILSFPCKL